MLHNSYVAGLFCISCCFEVVMTINDYQFKVLVARAHPSHEAMSMYLGQYGMMSNLLSCLIALFGTSLAVRRFGLRLALMVFPVGILAVSVCVRLAHGMTTLFYACLVLKALQFGVNNPCKEMLYSVTSAAVKLKAKSWIDAFGGRSAKAAGSCFNLSLRHSWPLLVGCGAGANVGLGLLILAVSSSMGRRHQALIESGGRIGEEGLLAGGGGGGKFRQSPKAAPPAGSPGREAAGVCDV
jgi:hypothetical protein